MRVNNSSVASSRRRLTPRGRRGHPRLAFETLERRLALALHIEDFSRDMDDANTPLDETKSPGFDSWDLNPLTIPGGDTDADPTTVLGPDEFQIPHQTSSGHVFFGYSAAPGDPLYDLVIPTAEWYEINFAANRNLPGGLGPDGEVAAVGLEYIGVGTIEFFGDNGVKLVNAKDWSRWDHVAVTSNDPSDAGFEMGAIQKVRVTGGSGGAAPGMLVDDIAVLVLDSGFSNNPPVAVDERAVVRSGAPADISVLNNDHDLDGDKLTIQIQLKTLPTQGIAEVQRVPNGADFIRYSSASGYVGLDSFTYTVSDGRGGTDSATVSISVATLVAVNDGAQTSPGQAVDIRVLENDIQPGFLFPLTLATSAQPNRGSTTVHGGIITYTPNAGPPGHDEFTYTIHDGFANSATATVHVAVNNRPIAVDHEYKVPHGFARPYVVPAPGPLTGAFDPDGESVHAAFSGQTFENITINADGSFIVSPSANGLVLPTAFAYGVVDEFGWSTTARVRLTVENTAPVAENATARYPRGARGPESLRFFYDDADGDDVTLELIDDPVQGHLVSVRNGGVDAATGRRFFVVEYDTVDHILPLRDRFTYRLSDGYSVSDVVTATIARENFAPEVTAESSSYIGGTSILAPTGTTRVTGVLFEQYTTIIGWTAARTVGRVPLAVDFDGDVLHPVLEDPPLHGVVRLFPTDAIAPFDPDFDPDDLPSHSFEYIPSPPLVRVTETALDSVAQDVLAAFPDRSVAIVEGARRLEVLIDGEFSSTEEFLGTATELLRDVPTHPAWERFVLRDEEIEFFLARLADIRPDRIFGKDTFSYRLSDGVDETSDVIRVVIQQSLGEGLARSDLFWMTEPEDDGVRELTFTPRILLSNDQFESGIPAISHADGFRTADQYVFIKATDEQVRNRGQAVGLDEVLVYRNPNWIDSDPASLYYQFAFPATLHSQESNLVDSSYGHVVIAVFDELPGDPDGVDDAVEQQFGGNGDGNGDGVSDRWQAHVATLTSSDGDWVTLTSSAIHPLWGVEAMPIPPNAPSDVQIPLGIFKFSVAGIAHGDATTVTLFPHSPILVNTYYKYGREPADYSSTPDIDERETDHWYEFLYNGTTGAQIFYEKYGRESADDPATADINEATTDHWYPFAYDPATDSSDNVRTSHIVLHLQDGKWGDNDGRISGTISDPGGPAFRLFPTIVEVSGPAIGVRGQPLRFRFGATAPEPDDPATDFTYRIDWNGDGGVDEVLVGPATGIAVEHAFPTAGNFRVVATATDRTGATSNLAIHPLEIRAVALVGGDLFVGGTAANDRIEFYPDLSGLVMVRVNGEKFGPFQPTRRLVAYGQAGNDNITKRLLAHLTAQFHGDAGNDYLFGGLAGHSLLVGGAGDDQLRASSLGRNILIGGLGRDRLLGQSGGSNLLIGGTTAHDNNDAALLAILAEWTSNNDFVTRVANLRSGGGLNSNFVLVPEQSVFDDGATDRLFGREGHDWFFDFLGDKVRIKANRR